MMQLDQALYISVKNKAEEGLFRIPGVRGVALGPKIVGGSLTGTPAIQVFVARKRPPHDLTADEQIPPEINGIHTDIIELPSLPFAANGTQQPCKSGSITAAAIAPNSASGNSSVVITAPGHGLATGNIVRIFGVPLDRPFSFPINVQDADTFTLPDQVELIPQQPPIESFASWRMTCTWENDLCGSPTGQITDATSTNPVVITSSAHGLQSGDRIKVVRIAGMHEIRGKEFAVASKDKDHFELRGVDGSFFTMATHENGEWAKLCIDRSGPIERVTFGSPIRFAAPGHTLRKGDRVHIIHNMVPEEGVVDPTAIPEITSWDKGEPFEVDTAAADTFTLKGVARAGGSGDTAVRGVWIRILPDDRTYSRIQGGIRIALDSEETTYEAPNADARRNSNPFVTKVGGDGIVVQTRETLTFGTLGCIAIDNETHAKVLLSNYHVLWSLDDDDNVHHPTYSSCKSHKIAKRVRHADPGKPDKRSTADAAIAILDSDVKSDPMIVDIGPVNGTVPISLQDILADPSKEDSDPRGYRVRKRGVTTLLTEGIVTSLHANFPETGKTTGPVFLSDQIIVQPMAGPYNGTFVLKGDSGSAVVNDQNMVVGLLIGGDAQGNGYVSPIAAIESELKVKVWAAGSPAPALVADGGTPDESDPLVVTPSARNLLLQVTEELLQTPGGASFLALFQQHQHEVQALVHHNRRVLIAWHRNEGPALLRELRRFVDARTLKLPSTINGKLMRQCLDNILAALQVHGSPQLVSDIQRITPDLFPLLGMSYTGALSTLSAKSHA